MSESEPIYHITDEKSWTAQRDAGDYRHPSLAHEGFIHCSDAHQVSATWTRIFEGAPGLVVLAIDPSRLEAPLRYEAGEPEEDFPHVYGPIPLAAIVGVVAIEEFVAKRGTQGA